MRMPVLFECPACGKKHYVAFCAANDGGAECGKPFVSSFFPSGRDALCPKHQQVSKPPAKGAAPPAEPSRSRCPSTQEELDLDAVLRGPAPGSAPPKSAASRRPVSPGTPPPRGTPTPAPMPARTPRPGSVARPSPAARPAVLDEDTPVSGSPVELAEALPAHVKCPACFVIYDRARNDKCPRCGASPDLVRKARREAPSAALESLGEGLTFVVLEHWRVLAVLAGVLVLGLGALAATASAGWVTAVCLVGVMAALIGGIGGALVYFRAIEIPFYKTQLLARAQGGGRTPSLLAQLGSALGSRKRRLAAGVTAPPAAEGTSGLREERSTDLAAGSIEGAAARGPRPDASVVIRASYLGGHPDLAAAASGRLTIAGGELAFESRRGGLSLEADQIGRVSFGWVGFVVAVVLAVAVVAALVVLSPGAVGSYRTPDWVPWGPKLGGWLSLAHGTGLGAAGLIVVLLFAGLLAARHVKVSVSSRLGDRTSVTRFRITALAALRLSRALS